MVTLASAILATIAAGSAAVAMGIAYARARQRSSLCWTISLGSFALATATLASGEIFGWSPSLFRLYYVAGGVINVPWMALGAVYLFGPRRLAQVGFWMTLMLTAVAVAVAVAMPVHIADTSSLPELKDALAGWSYANFPRVLAAMANAGGTPTAIILLLRASSTFRRKKVLPDKATGATIISIGIAAAATGGVLAALVTVGWLAPSLAVGAVLLLAGFSRWNRSPKINPELVEIPT